MVPKFTPIVTIATPSLPMSSVDLVVGSSSVSKVISTPPPLTSIVHSPSNLVVRVPEDSFITSRPSSSSKAAVFQSMEAGIERVKRVGHLKQRQEIYDDEDMETSSSDGDEFRDDDELYISDPGNLHATAFNFYSILLFFLVSCYNHINFYW